MKIELSDKKVVELKDYLTGRDIEEIEAPTKSVMMRINEQGKPAGEVNVGEAKARSIHKAIERVVISVDGKTEQVLDAVLDLPVNDYRLVLREVDKIVVGENFETPVSKQKDG